MTDVKKLRKSIDGSGISIAFLANKIGVSREGFYMKLKGKTEFKASEILALSSLLHLKHSERDAIFLRRVLN